MVFAIVATALLSCDDDLSTDSVPESRPVITILEGQGLISSSETITIGDTIRVGFGIASPRSPLISYEVRVNDMLITPDSVSGLTSNPYYFGSDVKEHSGEFAYDAGRFGQTKDMVSIKAVAERPGQLTGLSAEKSLSARIGKPLTVYQGYIINGRSSAGSKGYDLINDDSSATAQADIINEVVNNVSFSLTIKGVNGTLLALAPELNLTTANSADLELSYLQKNGVGLINNIAVGDVVVCRLRDRATYAAINITSINEDLTNDNDSIHFEYHKAD